jgi:hypothetical protein
MLQRPEALVVPEPHRVGGTGAVPLDATAAPLLCLFRPGVHYGLIFLSFVSNFVSFSI